MTFHYRYRKQILLATIIIIGLTILIGSGMYYYQEQKKTKTLTTINRELPKKKTINKEEKEKEEYMVDIKGEVVSPGIYKMQKSSRIIEVIEKAGGLTESADTTVTNLSKKITDEMVIIIYSKNEVKNWLKTKEQESYLQEKCQTGDKQLKNDSCITNTEEKTTPTSKININKATKEELMTLSGIGESKADSIIAYRTKTPFTTIEDLKEVSGIGDSIYEQIKNNITV